MDWHPRRRQLPCPGARTIGRGESISENTKTTGYFEFTHAFGNAFDNERNKPFDSFDLTLQFNFGDKVPLGQAQVVGSLYKKGLGDDAHPNHVFEIAQHYDYMNNEDYEFGGQSFGPGLLSRFKLGDAGACNTRVDATAMLLGAINSEYAKIASVGDRERLREYDYGPGLGAAAEATLHHAGAAAQAGYSLPVDQRQQRLRVQQRTSSGPAPAPSTTSRWRACASVPVYRSLRHRRRTDRHVLPREPLFPAPFADIDQRNPQVRVYLTVNGVRE
jgi:hypothetical protein